MLLGTLAPGTSRAVDKSGVSPSAISIPTGPGSIEGLGSEFEPHLNTGTFSYSVPLNLPSMVRGNAPGLSFSYDGGNGNSPLGIGWSLSVPSVRRQCEKGIPHYDPNGADDDFDGLTDEADEEDRFLDPSDQELVLTDRGYYYAENQEQFIRWRRMGPVGSDHWEGLAPDGTVQEFGTTSSGRIVNDGRIYRWCLERETDRNGNVIEYRYQNFPGSDNQKYCSEIRYGPGPPPWDVFYVVTLTYEDRPDVFDDYRSAFLVRTGKRLARVDISLQGELPDDHLVGDFNSDGTPEALIRRYTLSYEAHPYWSFLTEVKFIGADGESFLPPARFDYPVRDLPRVVSAADAVIGGRNEPLKVVDNDFVDFADLNADGLPDILRTELAGPHFASINEGVHPEGFSQVIQWSDTRDVDSTDSGGQAELRDLANPEVSLMDMDGDGLADLVFTPAQDPNPRYYRNKGDLGWGVRELMSVRDFPPPAPFGNADVRMVDLDFDKRIDIIRSFLNGYHVWYNLGKSREGGARYSERVTVPGAIHDNEVIRFADEFGNPFPGVDLADMNGDRVLDVTRIRPTMVIVAPSLGNGQFAEAIEMIIPPDDGFGYDQGFGFLTNEWIARAALRDISGNGLADLTVEGAGFREVWYWTNLGNGTFDQRRIVTQLPSNFSGAEREVRWVDLNGNGTTDLVYADSLLAEGIRLRTIDLGVIVNGSPTPNLLSSIENGLGMRTEIEYRSSSAYAADDYLGGRPWTKNLPNVTQVLSRVITHDGLSDDYVSEMFYHDGYYDPNEKEFRGFARAEQFDIGDESQPTLVTEYTFDVGDVNEPLKGKALSMRTRTVDGAIFNEESHTWTTRAIFTVTPEPEDPLAPPGSTFPFISATTRIVREEPGGATEPVTLEFQYSYDDYGNQVTEAQYGRVRPGDRNFGNDERIVWRTFSATPEAPIWSLDVERIVTDNGSPPRIVAYQQNFYDGPDFSGFPLGIAPVGNLTRLRQWVGPPNPINPPDPVPEPPARFLQISTNPDNSLELAVVDIGGEAVGPNEDRWIQTERRRYDGFGNATATADPLAEITGGVPDPAVGHFREVEFDELLATYPVRERIYTGRTVLETIADYDLAFGVVTTMWDHNGHPTRSIHDTFSRITMVIEPGGDPADSPEMPTSSYEYVISEPVTVRDGSGTVNWIETRRHEAYGDPDAYFVARKYIDGLGRTVMTKEEDEDPARTVVKDAKTFNEREKPHRVLLPFYSSRGLGFEDIRESGWSGTWVLDGDPVSLGLEEAPLEEMHYDALGRETVKIQPDGFFAETRYLPLRRRVFDEEDTDPGSPNYETFTEQIEDGLGRLIAVDERVLLNDDGTPAQSPLTWRMELRYDLRDDLVEVIDSQNNRRTMRYDAIKRKVYLDDPDRGRLWWEFDDASNIVEQVDAKGQRITFTHDGANRLLTEDYHDEDQVFSFNHVYDPALPISETNRPDVVYTYDVPAGSVDFGDGEYGRAINTMGRQAFILDLSGEEHYSYDEEGRSVWEVKRIPDPETGVVASYRTQTAWDPLDRETFNICPDGDRVGYVYNSRSLLEQITGGATANLGGTPFIIQGIDYIASGQMHRCEYGNGVVSTYKYDPRFRVTELSTHPSKDPGAPLIDYEYEFDNVSNVTRIRDLRPQAPVLKTLRNTQSFQYDDLYRLSRVEYSFSTPQEPADRDGAVDYRYDRIGNMIFKSSPDGLGHMEDIVDGVSLVNLGDLSYGGALGSSSRDGRSAGDPPGPHALTAIGTERTLSYDANGNITDIDGLHCTWDFKDRLVAVEDDLISATYTYDYSNRRVIKKVWDKTAGMVLPATTTLYVNPYYEIRQHDQPVKYVWHEGVRCARITGTLDPDTVRVQRLRLHARWNLLSLAVDNPDSSRQIAEQMGNAGTGGELAWVWDPSSSTFTPLTIDDPLSAGTPFWIEAANALILDITGTYADPKDFPVSAGEGYVPSTGFETARLASSLITDAMQVWFYDVVSGSWRFQLPGELAFVSSGIPEFLEPGRSIFVRSGEPTVFIPPSPANRIQYYHGDHLGSSNVVTDALGELVEETVFYPFGEPREEYVSSESNPALAVNYKYTGKELDDESGLQYFEARYLSGSLGRFLSVDPAANAADFEKGSQVLNPYAYAANNPMKYTDPDGRIIQISGSSEYKRLVKETLRGLEAKSRTAAKVIKRLNRDRYFKLTIQYGGEHKDSFMPSVTGGTVRWDPFSASEHGYADFDPKGPGTVFAEVSPAIGLIHELGHAESWQRDPKLHALKQETEISPVFHQGEHQWTNYSEKTVIEGVEAQTVREIYGNKTGVRRGHVGGRDYYVKNPFDLEEVSRRPRHRNFRPAPKPPPRQHRRSPQRRGPRR